MNQLLTQAPSVSSMAKPPALVGRESIFPWEAKIYALASI